MEMSRCNPLDHLGWILAILLVAFALLAEVRCAIKDNKGIEARIASDDTTTSGYAEGFMGPIYAGPYSPTTQTTIGTVALGSGWFCAPVALLALAAARWRGVAARRQTAAIHAVPSQTTDRIERYVERANRPRWWHPGFAWGQDPAERFIARSVKSLKKGARSGC